MVMPLTVNPFLLSPVKLLREHHPLHVATLRGLLHLRPHNRHRQFVGSNQREIIFSIGVTHPAIQHLTSDTNIAQSYDCAFLPQKTVHKRAFWVRLLTRVQQCYTQLIHNPKKEGRQREGVGGIPLAARSGWGTSAAEVINSMAANCQ